MESKSQIKLLLRFIIVPLLSIHYQLLLMNVKWERQQIKHETLGKFMLEILSLLWNYIFNIGM